MGEKVPFWEVSSLELAAPAGIRANRTKVIASRLAGTCPIGHANSLLADQPLTILISAHLAGLRVLPPTGFRNQRKFRLARDLHATEGMRASTSIAEAAHADTFKHSFQHSSCLPREVIVCFSVTEWRRE